MEEGASTGGFNCTNCLVTVQGLLVCNELFQYPILGSEKYHNEFPTPKYVGVHPRSISIQELLKKTVMPL